MYCVSELEYFTGEHLKQDGSIVSEPQGSTGENFKQDGRIRIEHCTVGRYLLGQRRTLKQKPLAFCTAASMLLVDAQKGGRQNQATKVQVSIHTRSTSIGVVYASSTFLSVG
jgi:hypothetical protein